MGGSSNKCEFCSHDESRFERIDLFEDLDKDEVKLVYVELLRPQGGFLQYNKMHSECYSSFITTVLYRINGRENKKKIDGPGRRA